ncbi:glycosyltransferase family 2 protein [Salisediminibacterium halotolerans]|uniref:Glycosyl transferase family 2 n=1 Tax=Salisediminibacterium halotolerans TaxID=517425 RepID=A0A1H9QHH4_9BACI|nr:glycosyltransferase family 2 protein [Salisediminibacterium haloalkalitolerans]SER59888.1 Glycosyl transferase family 2 [Salisediminibacterium haloalkalitolerans]
MNTPDFSIVIPHYNSSDRLMQLINTIPKYNGIEVLVIDDASDSKHIKKLNEVEREEGVKVYYNLENNGAGYCRNIGLNHSEGEWVIFADSDDYFLNDFVHNIYYYKDSDADIIFFPPEAEEQKIKKNQRDKKYKALVKRFLENPKERENELNLRVHFYVPWSKMIRKRLIDNYNIKFDHTFVSNDVMFSTVSNLCAHNIYAHDTPIYCVTKSNESLTSTVNKSKMDERTEVFVRRHGYIKEMLPEKEFKNLNINGKGQLYLASRVGVLQLVKTFVIIIRNNIKLI